MNNFDLIHKIDLEMFSEFKKICTKYSLNYYVIGGTFLGAIRHKGFIPWDDDMDIAMPRADYELFIKKYYKELPSNLDLITFENNEKYRYYLPRIVDKNYEIQEKRYEELNEKSNIFIDIFPIDGTPNNVFVRKLYFFRILFLRLLNSWYYIDTIDKSRKRTKFEKILILIGKIIPFKLFIKPKKVLKKIDNLMKKYDMNNSKYSGTIMGAYRIKEIVPTEYFGKPTKYKFEDTEVTGPEHYDLYLTHMYGDYMKLPRNVNSNQHMINIKKIGD